MESQTVYRVYAKTVINVFAAKILYYICMYIFIHLAVYLRQVQSLFQSELSTWCDLELPPSNDSILSFP